MTSRFVLKIRKRTQPEWLTGYIFVMPFLFCALFDILPLPTAVKYTLDVGWLFLLVLLIKNKGRNFLGGAKVPLAWVMAFVLVTFLVYLFSYQSVFYYLWGLRNNFRFYIFFLACVAFLKKRDVYAYLKLFDTVFWINAVVCLIQYVVFGKYGDWLGGVFGTEKGCNGYLNVFFVIVATKTIVSYIYGAEKLRNCIAKIGVCIVVAAFAELKIFYIEFIIILIASILITGFSWRKLLLIIVGILALSAGISVLVIAFPSAAEMLSLDAVLEYATSNRGYTSSGDINRLTAIPVISERFLNTGAKRWFGLGLGNCDASSFSFLTTPFYRSYGYMHYLWFSSASIFLEMGYFGLTFVIGFFIIVFFASLKTKNYSKEEKCACYVASVVALCCILVLLYDSTLRVEGGYMTYLVLSIPYIMRKHNL